MDVTIENFRKAQIGKIIALFNCRIGPALIVDMKLVAGRNGHFVAAPSRKVNGSWVDVVTIEQQALHRIQVLADAAYHSNASPNDCPNERVPAGGAPGPTPPPPRRHRWDPGKTGEDLSDYLTCGSDLGDGLPF